MISKICLLVFCLKLGLSVPVFYKEIHKNPSCNYWNKTHSNQEKSFLYLIGTAAYVEINVLRLKEHFINVIFDGAEASVPSEGVDNVEEKEEEEEEEEEDNDGDGMDTLFENMKKLRKSINEYFIPHLDEVIELERRMEEYNRNPLLNEFSLLRFKTRDLDCLLDFWITKRNPGGQNVTYTVTNVNYDIQFIHSEEVQLLDKMAERLDWFLSSQVLVAIVQKMVQSSSLAQQVERDLRQLRRIVD